MRYIVSIIITLTLAAAAFAQSVIPSQQSSIILKDLTGKNVSLSRYRGKIVLLNFWAIWCPPCLAEIPELVKWQKEYENRGLQIIGITYPPSNRSKVRRFVNKNKINYPILLGAKETKALFDAAETLPITVVIDEEGRIKEIIEGVLFEEEFDEKIKPLLDSHKKSSRVGKNSKSHKELPVDASELEVVDFLMSHKRPFLRHFDWVYRFY